MLEKNEHLSWVDGHDKEDTCQSSANMPRMISLFACQGPTLVPICNYFGVISRMFAG